MLSKFLGPAAALLLLAIETPVLLRTASQIQQREFRLQRPFHISLFEPVIITADPHDQDLFYSDRVLEVDGRPIRSRSGFEDAMVAAEPRGHATVLVEHHPDDGQPWQDTAIATFRRARRPAIWDSLASTAVFGAVIWPAVCVFLAAGVLAVNSVSRRAWLAALVLAGTGHFSWLVTSPYLWPEPFRTLMVVYDAAIAAAGPLALMAAALAWPDRAASLSSLWILRITSIWTIAFVCVRLAEKTSYALLAPFTFLDRAFGAGPYLLVMAAGITAAVRWSPKRSYPHSPALQSMATALRTGTWAFQLSLGLLLIFLPQFLALETVLQLEPLVWICFVSSLGFPLALAWVGSQPEGPPIQVQPLPPAATWPELFQAARQTAHEAIGLQLLAIYANVGDELRVQAAVPGAHQWPPFKPDGPPPSAVVQWVVFPQCCFALESGAFEDRQREALMQLAGQVAHQSEQLAAR